MGELIDRDAEHLRLLKLCYYILAGVTALYSLFPMVFLLFGSLIYSGAIPMQAGPQVNPRAFASVFFGIGIAGLVLGFGSALLALLAALSLRDHRRRTFCIVVAASSCLYIPWSTLIGVSTIVVLNRPTVKALFGDPPPQVTTLPV